VDLCSSSNVCRTALLTRLRGSWSIAVRDNRNLAQLAIAVGDRISYTEADPFPSVLCSTHCAFPRGARLMAGNTSDPRTQFAGKSIKSTSGRADSPSRTSPQAWHTYWSYPWVIRTFWFKHANTVGLYGCDRNVSTAVHRFPSTSLRAFGQERAFFAQLRIRKQQRNRTPRAPTLAICRWTQSAEPNAAGKFS